MRISDASLKALGRRALHAAIAALGLIAIVGSGGGSLGIPDIDLPDPGVRPLARVTPSRMTVEQGATAVFQASAVNAFAPVAYQWRRDGVDIAGATSPTYTLVGAGLGDDGASYSVVVVASNGTATATGELRVSPLPGIAYADGDFGLAQWAADVTTDPVQDGPRVTVSRLASGGNPDAFRRVTYLIPQGATSATVFHGSLPATYDPADKGPILVIDFEEDCARSGLSLGTVTTWPFFEQAGRRFAPSYRCSCSSDWETCSAPSRRADEFAQVDGPACRPGESCPDFSGRGPPIRLGFATRMSSASNSPAGTIEQSVDNWKVTVWRR